MKEGELIKKSMGMNIWSECPECGETNQTLKEIEAITPRYIYVTCDDCQTNYKVEVKK